MPSPMCADPSPTPARWSLRTAAGSGRRCHRSRAQGPPAPELRWPAHYPTGSAMATRPVWSRCTRTTRERELRWRLRSQRGMRRRPVVEARTESTGRPPPNLRRNLTRACSVQHRTLFRLTGVFGPGDVDIREVVFLDNTVIFRRLGRIDLAGRRRSTLYL